MWGSTTFVILFGATEFVSPWPSYLLSLCGHLQTFTLCSHYEQWILWKICFLLLDSRLSGHISTTLPGLKSGILWLSCVMDHFICDASPVLKISCSDMVHRTEGCCPCCVDWHIEISVCSYIFYAHHQDHHKLPFHPAKDEGLFYLFFSHDCGFYHLWQLYLHLCQTFSKDEVTINVCQRLLLQLPPLSHSFIHWGTRKWNKLLQI